MSNNMLQLVEMVQNKYGIEIQPHQYQRITNVLMKHDFEIDKVVAGLLAKNQQAELAIVDAISVSESYFYRDTSLFNLMEEHLLINMVKQKRRKQENTLRIWSAGCSRGEEIYSIVILLTELELINSGMQFEFLATDINAEAIDIAKSGEYSKLSLRAMPQRLIEKYFQLRDKKYCLDPKIIQQVNFRQLNINDRFCFENRFDMVLCRNVFIYFNSTAVTNALARMYQVLNDDGVLILGPSDFTVYIQHEFIQTIKNGVGLLTKAPQSLEDDSIEKTSSAEHLSYIDKLKKESSELAQIKQLLNERKFSLALKKIDSQLNIEGDQAILLRHKAEALAGVDDLATAEQVCDQSLSLDSSRYKTLLLKGTLVLQRDENSAFQYFQRAHTANQDAIEPLLHLAEIEKNRGNLLRSIRWYKSCLAKCELKADDYVLYTFHESTNGSLKHYLQDEIQRLTGVLDG